MHRAPNGGVLEIAPPNFSFINLTVFFKKWNANIFFIFKARLFNFWVIGHVNDLVTWYDCHNDRTRLSPVLGCGSLTPPHENITVKYPMTDRVNLYPYFITKLCPSTNSSFSWELRWQKYECNTATHPATWSPCKVSNQPILGLEWLTLIHESC